MVLVFYYKKDPFKEEVIIDLAFSITYWAWSCWANSSYHSESLKALFSSISTTLYSTTALKFTFSSLTLIFSSLIGVFSFISAVKSLILITAASISATNLAKSSSQTS